MKMSAGLPLDLAEPYTHLDDKMWYVKFDEELGIVHVRKYLCFGKADEKKPHKCGVCMSCEEFTNLLYNVDNLFEEMI